MSDSIRSKKKSKNSIVKKPTVLPEGAKLRKKPQYKSFRLHKRVKHPGPPLSSWWVIAKKAFRLLRANAKQIAWFSLIYGLLYLLFVRGFSSGVDAEEIRDLIEEATAGNFAGVLSNIAIFGVIIQSATTVSGEGASIYQLLLIIISALALIWLFRQQQAGTAATMKEAFYRGMFPLVPFILVIAVIGLQLIPAAIGNFLYSTVVQTGIAINGAEQAVWFLLFVFLVLLSAYMISSSIIALFIVTLPEMTPMVALRKAKELVTFRRPAVLRKMIVLLIFILFLYAAIVFPLIFISASLAEFVFLLLSILTVPYATAYLFVLYRELL